MDKPTKPTDLIPRSFGGVKNNFSPSLQSSGYEDGVPAIYGGDNLNYQLDATGKELDYCEKICDYINAIPIGKTVTVDSNNKLVYSDLSDSNKANISLNNLNTTGNNKILPSQTGNSGKYLTTNGTSPSWTDFTGANKALSNLTTDGDNRLHALKSYLEEGELLTDAEGLADVNYYAHSTNKTGVDTIKPSYITVAVTLYAYVYSGNTIYADSSSAPTTLFNSDGTAYTGTNWSISGTNVQYSGNNATYTSASNITTIENPKLPLDCTPIITADGVASGMVSQHTIRTPSLSWSNPFVFEFEEDTSTRCAGVTASSWRVQPQQSNNTCYMVLNLGGTEYTPNGTVDYTNNSVINYRFSWNGSTYKLEYKGDYTTSWTTVVTYSSTVVLGSGSSTRVNIGYSTVFSLGSYDLNKVKYYRNGELKYQPLLKIPYALSKTGSKVVDSAYRSRVVDMYNQFGYSPYYTLSDTDFTLPMGDLYGFIQNATDDEFVYVDQTNSANVISTATTIGTYDITSAVKALLPSDTNLYTYECLFYYNVSRSSGNDSSFYSALVSSNVVMYDAIDGSASTTVYGGQYKAVLKSGDTISLSITNHALTSHSTYLVGYRRLAK